MTCNLYRFPEIVALSMAMRHKSEYVKRGREILNLEIEGIESVRDHLGAGFGDAVELMLDSLRNDGKIVVSGVGKSLHIAEKVSATLSSTGSASVAINPMQAMHGDLGILRKEDVLLAFSCSGESDELINLVLTVKRFDVRIVAVTGDPDSSIARQSDVVINAAVPREACPFNMAPTASTTAALAAGDALAIVLLEARGFKKEDYAKLHPGGAIGRALLLRISDIMRKGDRVAVVKKGARVKEALMAMTRARAGSASVVGEDGILLGMFTDGDLRRHLADRNDLLDMAIEEVMTPCPITLRQDQLAVDALALFEKHNIDDVVIVDDQNRVVGGVDIQDLPKFKIM